MKLPLCLASRRLRSPRVVRRSIRLSRSHSRGCAAGRFGISSRLRATSASGGGALSSSALDVVLISAGPPKSRAGLRAGCGGGSATGPCTPSRLGRPRIRKLPKLGVSRAVTRAGWRRGFTTDVCTPTVQRPPRAGTATGGSRLLLTKGAPRSCGQARGPIAGRPNEGRPEGRHHDSVAVCEQGSSRHAVSKLRPPSAGAACKGDSRLDRITDTGWDGCGAAPALPNSRSIPGRIGSAEWTSCSRSPASRTRSRSERRRSWRRT